jgi:protein-tyrosine phosphatase
MKILFVCHRNDTVSPLAAGILKEKLKKRNIQAFVDSAGFEPHILGEPPDQHAISFALKKGIDISGHVIRLFSSRDFDDFDKIFVTDYQTFKDVVFSARDANDKKKVDYLMNVILPGANRAVPYPQNLSPVDFDTTYKLIKKACEKLADMM